MMFFLTKRCWPLLDKSFEEQQELNVSWPQVKWGPVYTLFSDYNVVVLYDGTFVEVNQLQRSTPQLPSEICVVTITISILQSPSTDAHHYHQMLSSYKDQHHNSSQKYCHNHPRSPPLTITPKQSSLLSLSPRLSSQLSPHMLTGDPSTMGEGSTLWSLWQL